MNNPHILSSVILCLFRGIIIVLVISISNSAVLKNGSVVCSHRLSNCRVVDICSQEPATQFRSGSCILRNGVLFCFPIFMIIGVMKSGTGALMRALNQVHPLIRSGHGAGHTNEIHYFTRYHDHKSSKISSMNDYLQYFPSISLAMVQSSVTINYPILFDKSPDYIRSKAALSAIKEMFPDMKHIAIFRDPVYRAISGFNHNCRHRRYIRLGSKALHLNSSHVIPAGSILMKSSWMSYLQKNRVAYEQVSYPCTREDFHRYYLNDENRLNWFNEEEVSIGYYDVHLKNLLACFPVSQILIILSHEMERSMALTLRSIFRFLNTSIGSDLELLTNTQQQEQGNSKIVSRPVARRAPSSSSELAESITAATKARIYRIYEVHINEFVALLKIYFPAIVGSLFNMTGTIKGNQSI